MIGTRGLYAIVDTDACHDRDVERVAEAILAGGCAVLQLRAKHLSDHARLALAYRIGARARRANVPFVMNDRPDLAVLANADGLHLGQDDLPIPEARRLVGAMHIGRSTHDLEQARRASDEGADIVAFGPIFETRSKADPDPVVGVDLLKEVCRTSPAPVVAIGGITLETAPAIVGAGARWGAVIGALCRAEDPEAAARALHTALGGRP